MFFRNLTLFRFPASLRNEFESIDDSLDNNRLKPVGPLELSSRGFVSPFGRDEEALSHRINDGLWLTLGGEDKILPSAVVNEFVARKAAEIEEAEGRKLGGRARKRLKEEILHELLPRAFVRPVRTGCHIDLEHGLVAVDTSSRKTAEGLLTELREAMGSFPAVPVNAEIAPRSVLTGWLAGEALPDGLVLGDECELRDPVDRGAVVKAQRQELGAEEITNHLEAGKQCSRLSLVLDDHLSFVLGDDLVVRKLKFLDGAVETLENTERDSQRAELDARYALMVGELRRLFAVLEGALKLSRVD
ncbi:recombination-associated protein RdgC [Pseudomarimonas salicorniae]|uniref:Recombination-associated protein RdgC n=1 Tax=Pseudomarimonas salicorniae TaxID=2933270 RepID=A0ABT0GIQ6_9GAMM|nr:recombination-associated protein RdgC [Lysobacter sp. CAU 1642]MCK7594423.1 recombination-associated protein RdgC [Lysobacter sp. CAU 1642]